jgi:hypothetical protein
MDSDSYLAGVAELYSGEVIGEGLGSRWLALAESPEQRFKLALFLQLESEAKVRLRPLLAKLSLSLVEEDSQRSAGVSAAEQFARQPWTAAMQGLADLSRPYLKRYEALLRVAPERDIATIAFMVMHEQAVVTFAEKESRMDPSSTLELQRLLAYPIPPSSKL